MIEVIALRMAEGIKKRVPDHPTSVAVMKHALSVLINTVSILVISLTIGTLSGLLTETAIVLISFPFLRMASGGLHLKSGTVCVLVTTSIVLGVASIPINDSWMRILVFSSLILVITFAPTDIHNQSRIPKKYYPLLKFISLLIVSSNFIIQSPIVAGSFFAQALTLVPWKEVKNKYGKTD